MTATPNPSVRSNREALLALCRAYGVASLDLFGSGLGDDWEPGRSDLDFLVAFHDQPGRSLADRYLGLAEDLERLFATRVELLTLDSIRNPYLRSTIEATRVSIYEE